MKKRFLSVILVLALCLTMLPAGSLPALAADTDGVHTHNYQYAPPGYGGYYFKEGCSCGHSAEANVNLPTLPSSYNGEPKEVSVTFSDNWAGAKNVTIEYYDASSNKLDTAPVNAGSYTVSITVNGQTYSGELLTISKANATDAMKAASGEARYGASGTVNLSAQLAEGYVLGTITTTDDDTVLSGTPAVNNGILSFAFVNDEGKANKTATITIPVTSSTNYNAYEIAVTVKVLKKYEQTISFAESTVTRTYGDAPFTIAANHTVGNGAVSYSSTNPNVAEVNSATGEVTIKKADAMPVTITATAAETDDYKTATATYSLNIIQKPLTVQPKAVTVKVNAAVPTFELAYDGLVSGESLTPSAAPEFKLYKSDGTTEITVEEAVKTAGTYIIKWTNVNDIAFTGAYANNYSFTENDTANLVVESESTGGSTGGSSGGGGGSDYTPPARNEPETGSSGGWSEIQDELTDLVDAIDSGETEPGETVTVDMNGAAEVPAEVLAEIAGKDVNVEFDMGGGIVWEVNGQDIPAGIGDLNLGIETGGNSIPVNVINTITGETATVQLELSHDGPFGTTLHLSLALGEENRGRWANLYYYDGKDLHFRHASRVDDKGRASWPFAHASSYVVVIDNENHDSVWVNPFADVKETDWFYEAVAYVNKNGLMGSTSTTERLFSPNGTTTRAQIVTILHRMEGAPVVNYLMQFTDVAEGQWHTEAIRWAAGTGITSGTGDGTTFSPNDPVTREQFAAFLYRYARHKGIDVSVGENTSILSYEDALNVSEYAIPAMQWTCGAGIIGGMNSADGGMILDPQGSATRAQAAVMLQRFCEKVNK